MRPFQARHNPDLPADNAAFGRSALEGIRETYRDGFWEVISQKRLADDGVELWHTPELVVFQGRSAGFAAFARQRLEHGRLYGHQRGVHFSGVRNAIGIVAAPAVVALMTWRVLRDVFSRRRYRVRVLLALPAIVAYNAVWAYAEARGHADLVRRR
jgi:hypothetical protein